MELSVFTADQRHEYKSFKIMNLWRRQSVKYSKPNERSDDIDKVLLLFKTTAVDIPAKFANIGKCVGGEQSFTIVEDKLRSVGKNDAWKLITTRVLLAVDAFKRQLFHQVNVIGGDLKGFIWIGIPEAISCETLLTLKKSIGVGKFELSEYGKNRCWAKILSDKCGWENGTYMAEDQQVLTVQLCSMLVKKETQAVVATSPTKAECNRLSNAASENLWICEIL
uniref:Uncharacterized protein n=1 Tax=Glossina austeni TaxID=7395 RepID=A0A1A9V5P7_GLOAU